MNLNDNSCKVIYNASAYKEEKDERIRKFLHFICTNEPGDDDFSNRLSLLVEKIKENEKFRREYAAMNLHDRDIMRVAKKEGIAQGEHDKAVESARNLLAMNVVTPEQIAQANGLPLEEVLNLQAELNK